MTEAQRIRSLALPIAAEEHEAPIVIRPVTPSLPRGQESSGGPMANPWKQRTYVLLEALPRDLQERVKTAVESMVAWG